jgi:hypothetical protein
MEKIPGHESGLTPAGVDTHVLASAIPKGRSLPASHRREYTLLRDALLQLRLVPR